MPLDQMSATSGNRTLSNAKAAKQDEFYTQLADIENELKHYRDHFRGKVVLCNCDDPSESKFVEYFASNFNSLGLKKLIATSYTGSPIQMELPFGVMETRKRYGAGEADTGAYALVIEELRDMNEDGAVNWQDVLQKLRSDPTASFPLKGDGVFPPGDFRSQECIEFLKEADVVVTNPPFSLFREYMAQLVEHNKYFLIIGNVNAIKYKVVFPLIQENRMWLGPSIHSGDREFRVPDHYPLEAAGYRVDDSGTKFIRVKGVRWFTNLDHERRHEFLTLFKTYSPIEYPKYDNYAAIEVGRVADIPADYYDLMGVPITFLDKYNPDQFEIIWQASGNTRASTPNHILERLGYRSDPNDRGGCAMIDGRRMYDRVFIIRR